jgi:hypothetical protein
VTEANKAVVRRLVEEVFNVGHLELIDDLYAPSSLRRLGIGSRRSAPALPTFTWRPWS